MLRPRQPLPPIEELNRLFRYDPATGVLYRRWRNDVPDRINKRFADKPAGHRSKGGYVQVSIDGQSYLAHRIIWKMLHGTEPETVDHRHGHLGNAPGDLRAATQGQNTCNRRRKAGKALPKGVFRTRQGKYQSKIAVDHKITHLGCFETPEEAHAAYCAAAQRLHGDFARFD